MADPVTIGAMGLSAAGSVISGMGSTFAGQAQSNMYGYQAGLALQNAQLARQDANYAIGAGEVEAQQSGMKTRAEVGQTRAAFGASNVAGASQDRVVKSETDIGQENQALIRANAQKRAFGFNVQAAKDTAQSKIYQTAAETSRESGQIGLLSSIIGGAGNVASKWMQYKQYYGSGDGAEIDPSMALA